MEYQDKINYQRYFFPAGRHKGIAFLGIILGLIFSSFGIVGFFIEKIPFMIALIFSVLGLLIIYGGLRLWLFKMEIKLSQSQLIVRSGMFSSKEIVLNSHDIQTLSNKVSMFVGKTQYYDIHAETLQGRKIRIAPHLKGIRDVDALMKKINDDLGLANN